MEQKKDSPEEKTTVNPADILELMENFILVIHNKISQPLIKSLHLFITLHPIIYKKEIPIPLQKKLTDIVKDISSDYNEAKRHSALINKYIQIYTEYLEDIYRIKTELQKKFNPLTYEAFHEKVFDHFSSYQEASTSVQKVEFVDFDGTTGLWLKHLSNNPSKIDDIRTGRIIVIPITTRSEPIDDSVIRKEIKTSCPDIDSDAKQRLLELLNKLFPNPKDSFLYTHGIPKSIIIQLYRTGYFFPQEAVQRKDSGQAKAKRRKTHHEQLTTQTKNSILYDDNDLERLIAKNSELLAAHPYSLFTSAATVFKEDAQSDAQSKTFASSPISLSTP